MELASDITLEDLQAFLQEAEEQLLLLDEDIVRLERESENQDLLQEIFRAAHTLKGSSAMLGHQRMAGLAHVMESVLDRVRKGSLGVSTEVVDALLHSLDALNALKEELVIPDATPVEIDSLITELERASETEEGVDERLPEGEVGGPVVLNQESLKRLQILEASQHAIYEVKVTLRQGTEWVAVRCFQALQALSGVGEIIASSPTSEDIEAERVGSRVWVVLATLQDEEALRNALQPVEDAESVEIGPYSPQEASSEERPADSGQGEPGATDDAVSRQKGQKSQTVRIDVERLDHLMNMIGELVIDRTRIVQIGKALEARYRDDEMVEALGKTATHIEKVVDELQETTMKVRMLPIGTVFNGFPRMIRDLAQKMDKKVNFVVDGQDTEIDRTVIDRIRDPLVHLLRNSIDHGIESSEERVAAGKPEYGTIWLSAYHEQGHIVITVEDDGNGIDPENIKASVVKKKLLSYEAASRLSDSEALELVFLPGASTAAETTDVSGRGVGMDIVRANIEAINGFVNLESNIGRGTKFTLKLPLTLATLQAILVGVSDTLYAIPLVYVTETIMVESHKINTVDGNEMFRIRENVLPLLRLSEVLQIGGNRSAQASELWVVIVKLGERRVGLAVDTLIELQEIVVKSLGRYIGEIKGVAGASVLGDGRVVLILDAVTLMNVIIQKARELPQD